MRRPSLIVAEGLRVQDGTVTATRVGGGAQVLRGPEPLVAPGARSER